MDESEKPLIVWALAGVILYVLIVGFVPAWMVTDDPLAGLWVFAFVLSISGPVIGAYVIYVIVRGVNRFDDPQFAKHPPPER